MLAVGLGAGASQAQARTSKPDNKTESCKGLTPLMVFTLALNEGSCRVADSESGYLIPFAGPVPVIFVLNLNCESECLNT